MSNIKGVEQIRFYPADYNAHSELIDGLSYIGADANVSLEGFVTISLSAWADPENMDQTYGYEIDLTPAAARKLVAQLIAAIDEV